MCAVANPAESQSTAPSRVLVLAPDFAPSIGGIQMLVHRVAERLPTAVAVVIAPRIQGAPAFDRESRLAIRRVRPVLGRSRLRKAALVVTMACAALREVRRSRFDVVLCAHVIAAPAAWLVARVARIPYVVWVYADEMVSPWRFWNWAFRKADRIVAISGHSRELAVRAGAPPDRTVIVSGGVDLPVVGAEPPPGAPDGQGGRILLTVSRMDPIYKGHDVVIRSLPLVSARVPDIRYVMVGDGRFAQYYRRLAHALGVEDRVTFAGRVSDEIRNWWLARCDVFVMLSRVTALDGGGEGFGIGFLEANAWNKPVVAGRAGGSIDAVEDGVSGYLVDPEDVAEVAETLIRLLSDRDLAERLGRQGRRRLEERFRWDVIAGEMERVLLDTAGRRSSRVCAR